MGFRKRRTEGRQDVGDEADAIKPVIRIERSVTWAVLMRSYGGTTKLYPAESRRVAEADFIVNRSKFPTLHPRLVRATVTYEVFDE